MSGVSITYKGQVIYTATEDKSFALHTQDQYLEDDITLTTDDGVTSLELTYNNSQLAQIGDYDMVTLHTQGCMLDHDVECNLVMQPTPLILYMTLTSNLTVALYEHPTVESTTVTVDWGDGTIESHQWNSLGNYGGYDGESVSEPSLSHTYASAGDYVIQIYSAYVHELGGPRMSLSTNYFGQIVGTSASKSNTSPELTRVAFGTSVNLVNPGSNVNPMISAFSGCISLTELTIPDWATFIPGNLVVKCANLSLVSMPNNLSFIGADTFYQCTSLPVNIEITANKILSGAYGACTQLQRVWIRSSVSEITGSRSGSSSKYTYSSPFIDCSSSLIIYCEADSQPSGWGTYWNVYEKSNGATLQVVWGQKSRPW